MVKIEDIKDLDLNEDEEVTNDTLEALSNNKGDEE